MIALIDEQAFRLVLRAKLRLFQTIHAAMGLGILTLLVVTLFLAMRGAPVAPPATRTPTRRSGPRLRTR